MLFAPSASQMFLSGKLFPATRAARVQATACLVTPLRGLIEHESKAPWRGKDFIYNIVLGPEKAEHNSTPA